ncbi:MAG: signal peptide peptidase SppA [Pseudomonadota bacterium]
MTRHTCLLFSVAVLGTWTLSAAPAAAQGLADPVALGLAPPTSVATVDEASAVLVNPAGVGFVTGPELMFLHSSSFGSTRSDVDSLYAAVTLLDTLGVGAGFELARPVGSTSATRGQDFVRASLSYALRLDDGFSVGGSYHVLSAQAPGLSAVQMWNLGFQVRPFRFLSAGAVVENVIPPEIGSGPLTPRAYRLGVGLRPGAEWATLGLEARIDEAWRVDPALLLRIEALPGIIGSVQLATRDLGRGFGDSSIGLGLEINHALFGVGTSVASSPSLNLSGVTVYARASVAAYPSLFPRMGRVVKLVLADDLRPLPPEDPWEAATYAEEIPGEIALGLERASRDDAVEAVWLEIRPLSAGAASVEAMRRRLQALRAAGKKVFVYLERMGNLELLLASAADVVIMPPSGTVAADGVGTSMIYLAATLERLGLRAHAVSAGEYKSAPETFTRTEPSPAALESEGRLLDVVSEVLVSSVAQGRGLDESAVRALLDLGSLSPAEARDKGLIDRIAYADEMKSILEEVLGSRPLVDDDYLRPLVHRRYWARRPTIAVVPIVESITMGRSSRGFLGMSGNSGADDVVAAIEAALDDDDVKAIVLRVNSPGGDALASDLIWRAVEHARSKKPVVASMGDVAASGGYYVACGASTILAEPTTITGSIGVFALFFTAGELLTDLEVGIHEERRSALAGSLSPMREPTDEELAAVQRSVDGTYALFKSRVAAGRQLSETQVEEVARGRVWTGRDALAHKLVDKMGGLYEAVAEARSLAGIGESTDVEITVFESGQDPLTRWSSAVEGTRALVRQVVAPPLAVEQLASQLGQAALPLVLAGDGRPLALMPYTLQLR